MARTFTRLAAILAISASALGICGAADARTSGSGFSGSHSMESSFRGGTNLMSSSTVRDHRGGDYYPDRAQGGVVVAPTTGWPRYCTARVAHPGCGNPWPGGRDHR